MFYKKINHDYIKKKKAKIVNYININIKINYVDQNHEYLVIQTADIFTSELSPILSVSNEEGMEILFNYEHPE